MKCRVGLVATVSLSLGLALTACGGGGVSSTPSPAPGPTPTPATYESFDATLAKPGDKSFQTAGVSWQGQVGGDGGTPRAFPLGDELKIEFLDADDTYRVTPKGGTSYIFGPAFSEYNDHTQYVSNQGDWRYQFEIDIPKVNNVPLSYTRFATLTLTEQQNLIYTRYRTVWGIPTQNTDLPKSGTADYALSLIGSASHDGVSYSLGKYSAGTLSANFSTGAISTNLTFSADIDGAATPLGTVSGDGTITSGTSGFSGALAGSDAGTGVFGGGFFGPQAEEVGYAWSYDGPDMQSSQGFAAGSKH